MKKINKFCNNCRKPFVYLFKILHMKRTAILLSFIVFATLTLKANTDPLKPYTGKYKFPEGSVISEICVQVEQNELVINSSLGTTHIVKRDDDHFAIPTYNGTAVFVKNSSNKITGIKIEAMGYILEGTKEECNESGEVVIPVRLPIPMIQNDATP